MCELIDAINSHYCTILKVPTETSPAVSYGSYQDHQRHIKFSLFHKYLVEKLHGIMSIRNQPTVTSSQPPGVEMKIEDQNNKQSTLSRYPCGIFEADFETFRLSNSAYSLCTTIRVDRDNFSVEVRSTVLKGGRLLQVKSPAIRLLLCRYLNRLNGALFDGNIVLNPQNGTIVYRLYHVFTIGEFDLLMHDIKDGPALIESYVMTVHWCFNFNIYKIIYLMDEISL